MGQPVGRETFDVGGVTVDLRGERAGLRRDPHGLAIHGLLAADPGWQVEARPDTGGAGAELRATLDIGARPELLEMFPFPHGSATPCAWTAARSCSSSRSRATGDVPVPLAHGLHPYLQLPGVPREEWVVTLPARRHLLLDDRGLPSGESGGQPAWTGPLGTQTFDDAYDELGSRRVLLGLWWWPHADRDLRRRVPGRADLRAGRRPGHLFRAHGRAVNGLVTGSGLAFVEPGETGVSRCAVRVSAGPAR